MRYTCTEWLEGFTVGAVYATVYHPGTSLYHLIDDEGVIAKLNQSDIELHFEEA